MAQDPGELQEILSHQKNKTKKNHDRLQIREINISLYAYSHVLDFLRQAMNQILYHFAL